MARILFRYSNFSIFFAEYKIGIPVMREDLLHYIWKYKKLPLADLVTTKNERIHIQQQGLHNQQTGPDFFNAKVEIDGQLWAGNVEMHLKSSDWYAHGHEKDPNYSNVILHVVWEDDCGVFRPDNSEIPTLELKNHISPELLTAYQKLFDKKGVKFINCEKRIGQIDPFLLSNWLERIYFERLEQKSNHVFDVLNASKNDWEGTLFSLLLKNFGLKVNGEAFQSLAKTLDYSVVRKLSLDTFRLESVLFGMIHLLHGDAHLDRYYVELKKEYTYLKNKFDLREEGVLQPEFFKLRPPNFPTIRLSQLANLYTKHQNLFDKLINANDLNEIYALFEVSASSYWDSHFTFGKESRKSTKRLTKPFIDLLVINTILPLKFCYAKYLGKDANEEIIGIASKINQEANTITNNYKKVGVCLENARDSQAALQLYTKYCTKNRCLQCVVGSELLQR